MSRDPLFPLFLKLTGRKVLVVGGGPVAAGKLAGLLDCGAEVTVVAPEVCDEIAASRARVLRRGFEPADVDGAWLVVAAAPPPVNAAVAAAAAARRVFVNAVDDADRASAYTGGVLRRGGVTLAVSTEGRAPALAGLLREALEAVVPEEIEEWVRAAQALRTAQRFGRVPMGERRPRLLEALNELYAARRAPGRRRVSGFVWLVGAGPGDPDFLTRRALRCLESADLVLYDALVQPATLALAPHAQCFSVGKRAGRKAMRQQTIHFLMIRAARRGKRVVRLKGGDPFVLGRGGEEALALAAAGVPFEVVPGVSSAVAAPGLAGIPVTHRGLASGFVVVSGHTESAYRPVLESLAPRSATVVVLMGLGTRAAVASVLLARGWPASIPAAIVCDASGPAQEVWRGTLAGLGAAEVSEDAAGVPGTLVVGEVAALAATIAGSQVDASAADSRLSTVGSIRLRR